MVAMRWDSLTAATILAGATTLLAGAVSAQVPTGTTPKPRFQGVEQLVEDVSPLAVSLRSFQTDLRQPSGFESVYRAPDDGTGRERLMRIDGALAATFPQSVYAPLYVRERFMVFLQRDRKIGDVPTVPAGTVFHIGLPEPPPAERPAQPRPRPELLVVQQPAVQRVEFQSLADAPQGERSAANRITRPVRPAARQAEEQDAESANEDAEAQDTGAMREERLRELLRRAVENERATSQR
jgi:hypothetical protein